MSSASRELSLADGQPIRLYQFSRGVLRWSYTSADRNITYNNQVFRSVRGGIGDPGIIQSGDPQADRLVITAPADLEVALLYKGAPPSDEIGLTVFDLHYGEADAWVSWAGSIATVNWPALDRCRITCLSIEASMDAPGLTDVYSRTCTAVLGDTECKVKPQPVPGYHQSAEHDRGQRIQRNICRIPGRLVQRWPHRMAHRLWGVRPPAHRAPHRQRVAAARWHGRRTSRWLGAHLSGVRRAGYDLRWQVQQHRQHAGAAAPAGQFAVRRQSSVVR